jgi:hypothetical protein
VSTFSRRTNIGAYLTPRAGLVRAASAAGTRFGPAIDRTDLDSCMISYNVDAITGAPTSLSITVSLQDSPDATTWTDRPLAGSAVKTTATAECVGVDCNTSQLAKFVRVKEVVTFVGGTAPTADATAHAIFGAARKLPI